MDKFGRAPGSRQLTTVKLKLRNSRNSAIFWGKASGLDSGCPARAPGFPDTENRQKSAIFISPGVLTNAWEMVILQDEAPKLPEILEISSGYTTGRPEGRAAGMQLELERNDMDWLLGLLIPVKWALVLIAVYFLLVLIL